MIWLYFILICLGSSLGSYLYLRPKLKITKKLNEEIQEENEKLYRQNDSLKIEYKTLQESIEENQKTA